MMDKPYDHGRFGQEMAVDPAIVGVIGPWSAEAAAAAAKTYREANLPVVYPGLGLGQLDTTGEINLSERVRDRCRSWRQSR